MFKAKVVLYSDDGKEWTISRIDYVTSDINPKTGKMFRFGKPDFVESETSGLKEGNVLVKTKD